MSSRIISFLIFIIVFLLYSVKTFGWTSSYSVGAVALMLSLCLVYAGNKFPFSKWLITTFFMAFFLVVQLLFGYLIVGYSIDSNRFFSHYIAAIFIVTFLFVVGSEAESFLKSLNKALLYFFYLMPMFLILALLNAIPVHSFGVNYSKPMFPFQEPSHYFNMLTICSMVYYKNKNSLPVFIIYPISLLFYPSATGVFGFGLFLFFLLLDSNVRFSNVLLFSIVAFLFAMMALTSADAYYLQRILFWNSDNLSALVFLQGFESAYLGFFKTYGLGVGMGQMSEIVTKTHTAQRIIDITNGIYFNIYEGGFVLSQILTEFGIFGLLCFIYLIVQLCKSRDLIRSDNISKWLPPTLVMASLVEIMVRGYGLFTPLMIFCYIGLFILNKNIQSTKMR